MRETLLDLVRVPRDGLVLLGRYWPSLVAVCATGLAMRQVIVWVGVYATLVHPTVGALILPLAPMSMMVALVLMLRLMRPSLSALIDDPVEPMHQAVIAVLLPFLAVYAAHNYLAEDRRSFLTDAVYHELLTGNLENFRFDRAIVAEGIVAILVIIIALAARKVLIWFELPRRHIFWGGVAVYIEVLWMMFAAGLATGYLRDLVAWIETRMAWSWWLQFRSWLVESLGALGRVISWGIDLTSQILADSGELVIVPIAWLAMGALVYGPRLVEHNAKSGTLQDAAGRMRTAASEIISPVTEPIQKAWAAVRMVALTGLGPMVLFCFIFVLAQQVMVGVVFAMRWLIGPQALDLSEALGPIVLSVRRLVYLVVVMSLLGAAINRVMASLQRKMDVIGWGPTQLQPARFGISG